LLLTSKVSDFSAVLTGHQTAGRGRLGRLWISPAGNAVALSFVTPQVAAEVQQWVPLVAGASMTQALHSMGITQASLKWPNDILVGTRKLSGILCESRSDNRVVVGIGVNVCFPADKPPTSEAISLSDLIKVSHGLVDALLARSIRAFRTLCDLPPAEAQGWALTTVSHLLGTLGRKVSVHEFDGTMWSGVAESLGDEGHLMVIEDDSGRRRRVVAADVKHLRE